MKENEKFSQLLSRRYRAVALFGPSSSEPYDELIRIRASVIVAARMLNMTFRRRNNLSLREKEEKWEDILWDRCDDDQINQRLNRVIESIESIVHPVLRENAP